MRVYAAFVGCLLALASGCAQNNQAIAAKPTTDELLQLKERETPVQATVAVEDRDHQAAMQLVPDFKQPELTPEERAALGQEPLDYKFLPYRDRTLPLGSPVGPWFAGVETATAGYGRPSIIIAPRTSVTGIVGWGGVMTGVDPFRPGVTSVGYERAHAATVGPEQTVTIETDPTASTVARSKPRIEK